MNHSFYAPSLGQQMNAIPGDVNTAPLNAALVNSVSASASSGSRAP